MFKPAPATPIGSALLSATPTIRIARAGATALALKLSAAMALLALQVSLARALGPTGYGEFAYVFAWQQLLLLFAQGGISTSALRYAAQYRARGQWALARGFVRRSVQFALVQSAALAMLMAGCALLYRGPASTSPAVNFLLASAALPLLAQFRLRAAIIQGIGRVATSMLASLVYPLVFLGAVGIGAWTLREGMSSQAALAMNLLASLCALGVILYVYQRLCRDASLATDQAFRTPEWLTTAAHMTLASSLIYLQGRTGVIITGYLLDARAAGTYAAMERLADVALLGLTSVNMLAAPTFAALHAQGRRAELQRYARLAAWGATSVMLATVIPLLLFGKPILRTFGDEFVSGYPALVVLLGGVAVNAMCGSVGYLLNMTGNHGVNLLVALLGVGVNLTLSFILVPRYGIVGTAVANAASIGLWNVAMVVLVHRRLRIWPCVGPLT